MNHEYNADCICDVCLRHGSWLADMVQVEEFERRMMAHDDTPAYCPCCLHAPCACQYAIDQGARP